jgi:hypothetical protein
MTYVPGTHEDAASATLVTGTARLVEAAIALCWSEWETAMILRGEAGPPHLVEPWPEMDALLGALDAVKPGWRSEVRTGG